MTLRLLPLIVLTGLLGGCFTPTENIPDGARTVQLQDFTTKSEVQGSNVIEVPTEVTAEPEVVVETEMTTIGDTEVSETSEEIRTQVPGVGVEESELGTVQFDESVRAGVLWPVDGLVGQINGRPVYAAEFFLPIQDRLAQISNEGDLVSTRRAIIQIVRERFSVYVNSELIIAEAESELTPDMQQGIFAWLGMMEGEVTAERGGTRFAAEQSIMDETGLTLEEYLEQQKNLGLAGQLLRKRVQPRAIISWRDIEQEYRSRITEFRPLGSVQIGRILLLNSKNGEKIEQAKTAFAAGSTFSEVVDLIEAKDDGFWRNFQLKGNGLKSVEGLRVSIRDSLEDLGINNATPAVEGKTSTSWYAVLGYITPPSSSIFDPQVQLGIRNKLESIRYSQQEEKYLTSLRRRWVNDDIRKMEIRLVEMALRRYWQS